MPRFIGPAPAHVAEWASILQTMEDAGRHPARTPEARQQSARDLARSEERLQRLRSQARCLRDLAPSSDDSRPPGDYCEECACRWCCCDEIAAKRAERLG